MVINIIIIALVALVFALCLRKMIAGMKHGGCDGCSGNCASCGHSCQSEDAAKKN